MTLVDYPGGHAVIHANKGDHVGRFYALGGWYELDLLDDARDRVTSPGTAVDVGAHIGGHSLWLALAMGLDVVAIEPNPATITELRRNVDANPAANIRVIEAAAGAEPGTASVIPARPGNSGTARIEPGGDVEVITIDSLGLTDVQLIKIDVEGMAAEVLRGAARTIDACSPIIYAEAGLDEIRELLPDGYRCIGRFANTPTYGFTRDRRPMHLSAAVMAHPARDTEVEELLGELDRDIPVAWDNGGAPSPDPQRRWATGMAAWEMHNADADWHMVIQDDAVVCPDLLAGLEAALSEIGPEGLVSAYTGTGRPDQHNVQRALAHATDKGHAWLSTYSLNWGVAIIAPVHTIPDMLEWCSQPGRATTNYDMRIGQYYRDILGWRTWYTHPSLVDHRDDESLIGHGGSRVAHIHHQASALGIDWSRHDGLNLDVPAHRRRTYKD